MDLLGCVLTIEQQRAAHVAPVLALQVDQSNHVNPMPTTRPAIHSMV